MLLYLGGDVIQGNLFEATDSKEITHYPEYFPGRSGFAPGACRHRSGLDPTFAVYKRTGCFCKGRHGQQDVRIRHDRIAFKRRKLHHELGLGQGSFGSRAVYAIQFRLGIEQDKGFFAISKHLGNILAAISGQAVGNVARSGIARGQDCQLAATGFGDTRGDGFQYAGIQMLLGQCPENYQAAVAGIAVCSGQGVLVAAIRQVDNVSGAAEP